MPSTEPAELTSWLTSTSGAQAIGAAEEATATAPTDPLAAATTLRGWLPRLTAAQAAAALEQSGLRARARTHYGITADALLLSRDGLEQATRPAVAAYRAGLMYGSGVRRVVDLTAGLGFDAAALCEAGITVTAVERDPRTAAFCRHNLPGATVIEADATDARVLADLLATLEPTDAVFVDPARRDPRAARDLASGRARPERDPQRWSPPWSFIESIQHPRVAAKVAPAFTPPSGWHATWTSIDRVVVECGAYSWPVFSAARRAVVHSAAAPVELDAVDGTLPRADHVGSWLIEPDPAVERALALAALPDVVGVHLERVDDDSSWLTTSADAGFDALGMVRAYRVIGELSGSTADQRHELRRRSIDRLSVKSRDVKADPRQVLRDLGCREGTGPVLILTRRAGRTLSVLVDAAAVPRD